MNYYDIWFNLVDSRRDLEFAEHLRAYLDFLKERGAIEGYRLTRRKFGFGPEALGEFHCSIMARSLAQLDEAFALAATRRDEVETLHHRVFSMVTNFKSALYRDFPDAERMK